MFENLLCFIDSVSNEYTYTMDIEPDEDGYIDKECPDEDCRSKFKVFADDWNELFSDEVHCPFCGHIAPAKSWWTTEQVEQLERQAVEEFEAKMGQAIKQDIRSFNQSQKSNSFLKISMSYSGRDRFVNLPSAALEELEQQIQCEKCGTRYAVVGSAFFCPCCGYNSAKLTFENSIEKVRSKIRNLETIRYTIEEMSKDEAARICESLIESSISDLVVAFQRVCECVYPQISGAKKMQRNVFQRLDDGNKMWHDVVNEGYDTFLTVTEYSSLKKCFQRRHVLQHKDGVVDQDYIDKSGDMKYQVGQRPIISADEVLYYANIVEKLGKHILSYI